MSMKMVEIDDETFADLEVLAKQEHASFGSVIKRALRRLPKVRRAEGEPAPIKMPHEYKIPISEGDRPFTSEDVYRIEEENDLRGLS